MTITPPSEGGSPAPASAAAAPEKSRSPWKAFQHRTFTVVWIATAVSNIGSWMYSAAGTVNLASAD